MPKGFLGPYTRQIMGIEEEVQTVQVHVQWITLRCGHVLRETGENRRKRPYGKLNCVICEAEERQKSVSA